MRRNLFLVALSVLTGAQGCSSPESPVLEIHYLGHASFLMAFPGGPTVLTDYGESDPWGLDSPVYPLGEVRPDIVTRSHDHLDHAGGTLPEGIPNLLLGDRAFDTDGLTVSPIPTFEGPLSEPDNHSFLFEFDGLRILHLGDCQGLMVALGEAASSPRARGEMEDRIQTLYPDRYDLVLLPIGFTRDILMEAAEFVALLDAGQVIPMHYWSPGDRDTFLGLLEGGSDARGRPYRTVPLPGPRWILDGNGPEGEVVVVGLVPGPPGSRP